MQRYRSGALSPAKQAVRLRGRLQFADGQLLGRLRKLCLRVISDHAFHSSSCSISSRGKVLLNLFRERMASGQPRIISLASGSCWYLLFTDACCEPDRPSWCCGLGGSWCTSQLI